MAAKAKLSVLGLYQWNHRIFEDMALPEDVDGETLTWKILEDCAELEVLYSDPDYMQASIAKWSAAMLPSWTKMQEALTAEYNPIWNKDGTVTEIEKHVKNNNYTDVTDGKIADHSVTKGNQNTETSGNEKTNTTNNTNEKDYVFGFNSESAAQSGETVTDDTGRTNTDRSENSKTNSSANTDATTTNNTNFKHDEKENIDREYTRTEQGNIGITTTQQMINEEREVDKFNLMDYIIDSFKKRFCLLVY